MLNEYEWYRRLRGGLWFYLYSYARCQGWRLADERTAKYITDPYEYFMYEDYRNQSLWTRFFKYYLSVFWYEITHKQL